MFILFPAPDLLQRHARHRTAHGALLAEILNLLVGQMPEPPARPQPPLELPSASEIRVLRYLPTNLSLSEIANQLYISHNTVRTHVRHLHTKLGTHRRSDTVARARALGLLAPLPAQGRAGLLDPPRARNRLNETTTNHPRRREPRSMRAQIPKTSRAQERRSEMMTGNTDFGTFGRFTETPVSQMPADLKDAYDFTMKLRGLVPGPHKIWLANPTLSRTIVPTGAYYQTESTLTKAEIEIATSVINGRWGAAYANHEHEKIGEQLGHLPAEKVERLIAGLPTSFEDSRQQVVYELACTLAAARIVPQGLFRRAQDLIGDAGIVDVTVLMGWFTSVSLTLMAYDVPSDATGLDQ